MALAFLPIRLLQEANPIWRLVSWSMAIEVVVLTLAFFYWIGGRSWARHFAFPICFFLMAVPWPSQWEAGLIDKLTAFTTGATVEVLTWWGIPALQHGNVIEIGAGTVGIDEACSGIRSFQATLMIALFLGELYRFKTRRRLALLGSGIPLALFFNVCRTFTLVWVTDRGGLAALHRWHDRVGMGVLVCCFAGLWLLAHLLRPGTDLDPAPSRSDYSTGGARSFPAYLSIGLLAWLGLVQGVTEAWYRVHENPTDEDFGWSVRLPRQERDFRNIILAPETAALLQADEAMAGSWTEADGSRWQMNYFRWYAGHTVGERVRVQLARCHRPDHCLPSAGKELVADLGYKNIRVGDFELPFRHYVFSDQGIPMNVYFCLWEEATHGEQPGNMRETPRERIRAALHGNRSRGQRTLEFAIWGLKQPAAADEAVSRELKGVICQSDSYQPSTR